MPLNDRQKALLKIWMDSNNRDIRCPICRANNWADGGIVVTPPYKGHSFDEKAPIMPLIQMICNGCGYVFFVAAKPVGIDWHE